jgi:hypothetical protein
VLPLLTIQITGKRYDNNKRGLQNQQPASLPYTVYLSASGLTNPINTLLLLRSGKRSFATSLSRVSINCISSSDLAALTNSLCSEP